MKYYEEKKKMRRYIDALLKSCKEEGKELSFVRVCLDIYTRYPMSSGLAVKKYLQELQKVDQGIYFDGEVIKYVR